MLTNIADLREDYRLKSLDFTDAHLHPFPQFETWFQEAVTAQILEPNAMILATVANGKPSARVVLLKGLNTEGFVFFTNYDSRKGRELEENPHAALCFNWLDLQRQVRIEGIVEKIAGADSDAYFNSRPFGSRIGAWASPQSQIIANRTVLEENLAEYTQKYGDTEGVPRPPHWGGYVVIPHLIEFWQGRSSRLHDRICYTKTKNNDWEKVRLAP
ncbi:MAG: pyridoxamine 5'-phosphate oxidase [Saprospiraceae bacterium]|nr:pyridoxamine 5'-phosphate oxidase [Saprospiraceae bacterium]